MYSRLAYRQMEQGGKINILVVFQQIITFILCISCVSVLMSEAKYISGILKYLNQQGVYVQTDGIVDWDTMKMVQDSSWLEERMNSAHAICCYSIVGEIKNKKTGELYDLAGRAYDQEILEAYEPEMLVGDWLDKTSKQSETLPVVITENTLGLTKGDCIYISGEDGEEPLEATIVGVVKNQSEIFGYSCIGEADNDYRMFYETRDIETEKKPIILIAKQELEKNLIAPPIDNSIFFVYDENITKEEKEKNRTFLTEECGVWVIQDLDMIRKNSINYLWSKLSVIFPVFICILVLTVLTQCATSVIIGKRNLRSFMIYRLCGAEKRKIQKIALMQSVLLTGKALVMAIFGCWIFEKIGIMEGTVIEGGCWQILACLLICIGQIGISYGVQWGMIHDITIVQGLCNTKDSEG